MKRYLFIFFLAPCFLKSQSIANYIRNGSFEEKYNDCLPPVKIDKAVAWLSIDSISYGGTYRHICLNSIPLNGNTFQYPKSGNAYLLTNFFDKSFVIRGYPKNRLKANLQKNKKYCVAFYANICNTSPRGIDGFGAYFGDGSIDTITKCTLPITYLSPQVQNPQGNVITDTLNWIPITGTFVATGNEKYLLLGNFYSDNATTTASINTPYYPEEWTDVCIDDVSCIEMDVAAYAGPDQWITPGDSIYIGRENDWAIDPFCYWYKLPNTITAIDTTSGIWVKPSTTTTYVVRQELECNTVKWDTVVVYMNPLGVNGNEYLLGQLQISPLPAGDIVNLKMENGLLSQYFSQIEIMGAQGLVIKQIFLRDNEFEINIQTSDLPSGIYLMSFVNSEKGFFVSRRLVVQH